MARWGSSWTHTPYRGGRRSGKAVFLLLPLALLLVGAAVWRWGLPGRSGPEPQPTAATVPPSPSPTPEPEPTLPPMPESVRGIYISGPVAGDPYMDSLISLVEDTELNAVVIDVKNDEGNLTYSTPEGAAAELGACVRYIQDLPALLRELKGKGIYTIARIAAFKDPVLAQARPELALRDTDGKPVAESGGEAWVDPCQPEVWTYLEEVALGAAALGFDEIQFDYVRFPTGRAMDRVELGPSLGDRSRSDVIAGFLEAVTPSLHAQGVRVSVDVFGTVITNASDAALIGQDYLRLAQLVDVVCPMVYPSHYAAGSFGLEVPDRQPYETVLAALTRSGQVLEGVPAAVRPWLQDFTATWVKGHLTYGPDELRGQLQAVYDAGYGDWLLWNARNRYTEEGLLKK